MSKEKAGVEMSGQVRNDLLNQIGDGMNIGMLRPYMVQNNKGVWNSYADIVTQSGTRKAVPLQTNATLRRDEWKRLDDTIVKIAEKELIGINDLRNAGLTYPLNNPFGTTQLEWHQMSDAGEAAVDMDAEARTQGDTVNFKYNYLPVPIVYMDYSLSKRTLEASRKMGDPLDTSMAERAVRKVNEKLEEMLFTDTTYAFGTKDENSRNSIYSYVNFPDRNTVTLSDYGNWDDSSTDHQKIIESVLAMKQASKNKYFTGPWTLYVPGNYDTALDEDYVTTSGSLITLRQRIEQISGINKVQIVDTLPDDNVLLVQMTSDVVRLVDGMPIQNIEWAVNGGFVGKFKVMTIQVPQIRSDYDGKCGIVHMS